MISDQVEKWPTINGLYNLPKLIMLLGNAAKDSMYSMQKYRGATSCDWSSRLKKDNFVHHLPLKGAYYEAFSGK